MPPLARLFAARYSHRFNRPRAGQRHRERAVVESGSVRAAAPTTDDSVLTDTEKRVILEVFETADANVPRAAESLGLHPNDLHRLITNRGL